VPVLVLRAVLRVLLEMNWHQELQCLLQQGLDPLLALTSAGDNLLHYACSFGASDCVRVILRCMGSKLAAHSSVGPLKTLTEYVNTTDSVGRPPLVSWVRHNADLRRGSELHCTPAAAPSDAGERLDEISLEGMDGGGMLLHLGARCTEVDHRGRTVLLHACDGGVSGAAAVSCILAAAEAEIQHLTQPCGFPTLKAFIQHVSSAGDTALYRAAQGNGADNEATVQRLLDAGALHLPADAAASTPLPQAGIVARQVQASGSNPLLAAIFRSRVQVVRALLQAAKAGQRGHLHAGGLRLLHPCSACEPAARATPADTPDTSTRLMQQIQLETGSTPLAWALATVKRSSNAADGKWLQEWWQDKLYFHATGRTRGRCSMVWAQVPLSGGSASVAASTADLPPSPIPPTPDQDSDEVSALDMLADGAESVVWGSDSDGDGDGDGEDSSCGLMPSEPPPPPAADLGGGSGQHLDDTSLQLPPALATVALLGAMWAEEWLHTSRGGGTPPSTPAQPPQAWGGCRGQHLIRMLPKGSSQLASTRPVPDSVSLVFGQALERASEKPPLTVGGLLQRLQRGGVQLDRGNIPSHAGRHDSGVRRQACMKGDGSRAAANVTAADLLARALLHAQVAWHRRRDMLLCLRS